MKKFGKRDIGLIITLLLMATVCWLVVQWMGQKTIAATVVVTVDGEEYGRYPLAENQEIPIAIGEEKQASETNFLRIQDGVAQMITADCPDQICVHQKAISHTNESIVCLPNRVVVTIASGEKSQFDSMVR